MDTFYQAVATAALVWQAAIAEVGWHHGAIALAYLGAAWLCLLNAHIARQALEAHAIWYGAAIALCLLGANTVLQADLFMTHLMRATAKLQGWYGQRQPLQYAAVAVLALLVLISSQWLRAVFTASAVACEPVALGMGVLIVLFLVRTVSAHGTDAVLNWRLLGVSVGRLLEFAGIAWVVYGARRCLLLR